MCIANRALNALFMLLMLAATADAGPLEYLRDRYQDLFGPTQYEQADAAYKNQDFATALKLWRPLADKGDNMAQWHLGVIYAQGLGVAQNDVAAAQWFRLAAEAGNSLAQSSLAEMYHEGRGVPKNEAAALHWYCLAAKAGDEDAVDYITDLGDWDEVCIK